jgi:hypothetical protein
MGIFDGRSIVTAVAAEVVADPGVVISGGVATPDIASGGLNNAIQTDGVDQLFVSTAGALAAALGLDGNADLVIEVGDAHVDMIVEDGGALAIELPDRWNYADLTSPKSTTNGGVTLSATAPNTDGVHTDPTITGDGTIDDGLTELELLYYDLRDAAGNVVDGSGHDTSVSWHIALDGTLPTNDAIVMAGIVWRTDAGTVVGVHLTGYALGSTLQRSAVHNLSTSNSTTNIAGKTRMWSVTNPDRSGNNLQTVTSNYDAAAGGSLQDFTQVSSAHSIATATRVDFVVAIGCNSSSTTPNVIQGLTIGHVATRCA